ncbi:type II toxin-antitoxin system VapC family toxin [Aquimonas voraii]|uniref:Predicted nucleic acid-binding protein, contains PIN domain n=1 Tax=Aquimonas voraii TaxID=265719 RepID=A0A1G7AM69_9GAMM|nr:PIN domain-containing protein [Aquimonas voraii]SDE14986.1 Predicted nucleic acid-binding protein, contains PIN domain [Aquimonas voraii]
MIAFLDANALIYLIEGEATLAASVRAKLQALAAAHPDLRIALSRLSWLECRVGPIKAGSPERLARFDAFFQQPDLVWVELERIVVELATELRGRLGLRTPDALQAACCLQLRREHLMLTGDHGFARVEGLNIDWI